MGEGLLSCEDSELCPQECPICATCLALLCEGVVPNGIAGPSDFISTPVLMYVLAAVVGFLLVSLAIYYARRRRNNDKDLSKSLMDPHEKGGMMYLSDGTHDGIISDSDDTSAFKPLVTKDRYTLETIQPVGTMSTSGTVSTGHLFRPGGGDSAGNSILPPPSDGGSVADDPYLDDIIVGGGHDIPASFNATGVQLDLETGMVSPMPTMEGSSDGDNDSQDDDDNEKGDDDNEHFHRGMSYFEKYALPDERVPASRAELN